MKSCVSLKSDNNKSDSFIAFAFEKDKITVQTSAYENDYALKGAGYNFGGINVYGKAPLIIQPKLAINEPGDEYEQEADAMADKVMRMPDSLSNSNNAFTHGASNIQRKCAHCEEEEE